MLLQLAMTIAAMCASHGAVDDKHCFEEMFTCIQSTVHFTGNIEKSLNKCFLEYKD